MEKVMSLLIALSLWHCAHGAKGPENPPPAGAAGLEQKALPAPKLGKGEGCCSGCPLALPYHRSSMMYMSSPMLSLMVRIGLPSK